MVDDHPWTRGGLRFTREAMNDVELAALEASVRDEEACGYLTGPAGDTLCDYVQQMENVANKLHARDPETYFRTGRTFFAFNEKRFADAMERAVNAGRPVKVLYHSHIDAGAYFSPTDAAVMSMGEPPAFEGGPAVMGPGPAWPLAFLVTSVTDGLLAGHGLFVWDEASRSFVATSFTLEDP